MTWEVACVLSYTIGILVGCLIASQGPNRNCRCRLCRWGRDVP